MSEENEKVEGIFDLVINLSSVSNLACMHVLWSGTTRELQIMSIDRSGGNGRMKVIVMKKESEPNRIELHVRESGKVDAWLITNANKYYRGEWRNLTDALNAMHGIGYKSEKTYDI